MNRFTDRNILVTGASSGIGKAVANELSEFGTQIVYSACDVSQHDESQKVIDNLSCQPNDLHGLSHNARILRCYLTHQMTAAEWDEIIATNLTDTFNVNKHAIPA